MSFKCLKCKVIFNSKDDHDTNGTCMINLAGFDARCHFCNTEYRTKRQLNQHILKCPIKKDNNRLIEQIEKYAKIIRQQEKFKTDGCRYVIDMIPTSRDNYELKIVKQTLIPRKAQKQIKDVNDLDIDQETKSKILKTNYEKVLERNKLQVEKLQKQAHTTEIDYSDSMSELGADTDVVTQKIKFKK